MKSTKNLEKNYATKYILKKTNKIEKLLVKNILVVIICALAMSLHCTNSDSSGSGESAESIAPADPFDGFDNLKPMQQMPGVIEIDPPQETIEARETVEDLVEEVISERPHVINAQERNDLQFSVDRVHASCSVREYKAAPGYDEQFLMSPYAAIYPGAVFDGTTIANGGYRPITGGQRHPLAVTAVGVNGLKGNASKVMENPSLLEYTDFLNDILARTASQELTPIANSTYTEVNYYDTSNFRNSLRLGVKADAGFVKSKLTAGFTDTKSKTKNRLFFRFNQIHFTMSVADAVPGFKNWYTEPPPLTTNVAPVYIDYVKYGRVFLVAIETSLNKETAEDFFELAFSAPRVSIDTNFMNAFDQTISDSKINVYVVGGEQELCNSLRDAESLHRCASQGGLAYINSAPIAYGLKYVHDGTAAEVLVNTQYKIRTCETQVLERTVRQQLHLAAIREVRPAPAVNSCPVYTELCHRGIFGDKKCRQVEDNGWRNYCATTFRQLRWKVSLEGGFGLIKTAENKRGFVSDPTHNEDALCFKVGSNSDERNVIFAAGGSFGVDQKLEVSPSLASDPNGWKDIRQSLDPQKEIVTNLDEPNRNLKICSKIRPRIIGASSTSLQPITGSWVINPFDITANGKRIVFSDGNGRSTEYCMYSKIGSTENPKLPKNCLTQ